MENIFKLTNVVLYAKDWYKKTDDIWVDLIKILELDNYTPFTKNDVFIILSGAFERWNTHQTKLRYVLENITESECWKFGYYTQGNKQWFNFVGMEKEKELLSVYNMEESFIRFVLSTVRYIDNKQYINHTPKYSKYPKLVDVSTQHIIQMFNKNKILCTKDN